MNNTSQLTGEPWELREEESLDIYHENIGDGYNHLKAVTAVAHAAAIHALNVAFDEIVGFDLAEDGESVQLRFSIEQLKSLGQWPATLMRKSAALKAGRKP